MTSFNLKYDIGDEVWDKLTLNKTKIIGIEMKFGKKCCNDSYENYIKYYVDNHTCETYRNENELEYAK